VLLSSVLVYVLAVVLQLVVCDSPAGRLGLTVCYDLRFPEVYQMLTWGMGAKVLLVPSAFTKVTGGCTVRLPRQHQRLIFKNASACAVM
jgi:predicted amidohydrolase